MRINRLRKMKHSLEYYKRNFGVREPYQILVDGTYCQAALKGKIQLKDQFSKYLGGEVVLVTTNCIIQELASLGRDMSGAVFIAKRLKLRSCDHSRRGVPATECIRSLIGEENVHHYFVATQDRELRKELSKVPGVALFHIIQNTIVLESRSKATKRKVEELTESKVSVGDTPMEEPKEEKRMKKKKGPKGPNPLSVKKSKKKKRENGEDSLAAADGGVSKSKKRRSRHDKSMQKKLAKALEKLTIAAPLPSASQESELPKPSSLAPGGLGKKLTSSSISDAASLFSLRPARLLGPPVSSRPESSEKAAAAVEEPWKPARETVDGSAFRASNTIW